MEKIAKEEWLNKKHEALKWLHNNFPMAFSNNMKPLKIGIHKDILNGSYDECPSQEGIISALKQITKMQSYLMKLKVGSERFDLQGIVCGEVTEKQAEMAKNIFKENKKPTNNIKIKNQRQMGVGSYVTINNNDLSTKDSTVCLTASVGYINKKTDVLTPVDTGIKMTGKKILTLKKDMVKYENEVMV